MPCPPTIDNSLGSFILGPMVFKIILCLMSFLLVPRLGMAGEATPPLRLSISDALRMAKERHVDVLVANERVQQAIARMAQAKSPLLPKLDGSVSQTRQTVNLKSLGINPNIPGFNPNVPPFNVFDARIILQQTLFDLTVLRRLKAAVAGQGLSQAEKEKAEADAMALVADLYLEAMRAEEAHQYVQALERRDAAKLRDALNRKQLGLAPSIEITQAQAALAQSKNQVAQAKAEKEERRLDLVAALGLPESQRIQFTSHENFLKISLPSEEEIRARVSVHPDVEVAKKQVEVATRNKRTEVAEYFPKLSASANYGPNGPHPGDVDDTYSYGGKLAIPIYQGGLRKAKVQEATSKIRESQVQLDQLEKDKLSQAFSALESLKQAFVGVKAAEANLTKASQELNLARQRRFIGVGDQLQVVEYEAQYAIAKDLQSEAMATYRLAWVNLTHRLGNMNWWIEERK